MGADLTNGRRGSYLRFVALAVLLIPAWGRAARPEADAPDHTRAAGQLPMNLRGGLVAWFPFDALKDGKVTDVSGHGRHGTVDGATLNKKGKAGGALRFDGKDDCVRLPDLRLKGFSLAAWVLTTNAEDMNNRRLARVGQGREYYLVESNSRGGLSFACGRGGFSAYNWQFQRNTWTHVAVTYDGHVARIYKNGILTRLKGIEGGVAAGPAILGGDPLAGGCHWEGMMDSLAIWSRMLSVAEVRQLYGGKAMEAAVIGALTPLPPEVAAQAGRLIKQLDAADFRTREQATKALTKECGKYRPLLVQALRSGKLSPEARARIEQVLRADALGSQAQKLLTELLKDPDYLINLLSGSPPKTRSAIAEHLRKITGADIAADPTKWRQWLARARTTEARCCFDCPRQAGLDLLAHVPPTGPAGAAPAGRPGGGERQFAPARGLAVAPLMASALRASLGARTARAKSRGLSGTGCETSSGTL